jgi:hypothetical protein
MDYDLWTMPPSERTAVARESLHRCDQMETVGTMGEETNVAGKMALRTGRNVLQFDT